MSLGMSLFKPPYYVVFEMITKINFQGTFHITEYYIMLTLNTLIYYKCTMT